MAQKAENHPREYCILSPKVVSQRKTLNKISWTVYKTLFKEFLAARSRGHIVNFSWLWSQARKLQLDIDPKVEVKHHVIVCLLQKKELRMMSKQRNKRKHKKEMEPSLKKWHATFREKCIRKRSEDPSYDPKSTCAKAKCRSKPTSLCCAR